MIIDKNGKDLVYKFHETNVQSLDFVHNLFNNIIYYLKEKNFN